MKATPRPSFPWVAVIVAVVVVAIGSFVLIDMKPWSARKSEDPTPTSTLKILGRDDPATLAAQQAEREEERRRRQRPRASASAASSSSSGAAPSASQSSTAEPTSSARP